MNDDNPLHDVDLTAWEVPAPRTGLADAVIAQARQPGGAPAIEPVEHSRRWWLAGGVGAIVATTAVAALVISHGARHAVPLRGELVSTRAQHLDLETASAELDRGASVKWQRDDTALTVDQRGTATWTVAGDERLHIVTGPDLGSVEATGASLRVEAHMNFADARVIGATTVTAAAVAFVTVVVFDGHVSVIGGGKTIIVEPGMSVELRPGRPPEPADLVSTDERIHKLEAEVETLQAAAERIGSTAGAAPVCDEVSCVLSSYAEPCCAQYKPSNVAQAPDRMLADALDHASISASVAGIKDAVRACVPAGASLVVKLHVNVAPDGTPASTSVDGAVTDAIKACVSRAAATLRFPRTRSGGSFTYPFVLVGDAKASAAPCEAQKLADQGKDDISAGHSGAALDAFTASYACKPDPRIVKFAYMAACNAENADAARLWFSRIPDEQQRTLVQVCLRKRIDPRASPASTRPGRP